MRVYTPVMELGLRPSNAQTQPTCEAMPAHEQETTAYAGAKTWSSPLFLFSSWAEAH